MKQHTGIWNLNIALGVRVIGLSLPQIWCRLPPNFKSWVVQNCRLINGWEKLVESSTTELQIVQWCWYMKCWCTIGFRRWQGIFNCHSSSRICSSSFGILSQRYYLYLIKKRQNYCHHMRFWTGKCTKMRFRPGFARTHWRSLQHSPSSPKWIKGRGSGP